MVTRTINIYRHSFSGLSRSAWLLSLVSLINRSGTMVIPFLTVYLTTQKGFTLGQAGWAMTFFGLGSVAGSYLGGRLTDLIGYYKVQFWSLFLGGIMFLFLGYMDTHWHIYLMIFILSVLGDAFRPATLTAIAVYSKPENRTRSFSLMRMAINLGWSVGPAIGGWLAAGFGYMTLFWADGLTCIAAAMVFRIFLSEKTPPEEKKEEGPVRPALSAYRDRNYIFFLVLTTLGAIVFMQFLSTLPVFYKQDLGMSEGQIGLLLAMNGLIVVALEMPLVYTLERRFKRLDCIAWGILLYAFTYLVFNVAGATIVIAVISMIALSLGEIFNMPFTNSYALSRTTPANRGQYMGLFSMSYSIAHIFAPTVGMQIAASFGFSTLWWVLGALCLLAYVGTGFLKILDEKETAQITAVPEREEKEVGSPV